MKKEIHNISPVYDNNSKILILGSFPSVKSREAQFFYGHPRNRFWQVLSEILCEETPKNVEYKKAFLLNNHIAVWDVISSCDIEGSSDSSIKNVVPNDISIILKMLILKRFSVTEQHLISITNNILKKLWAGKRLNCLQQALLTLHTLLID